MVDCWVRRAGGVFVPEITWTIMGINRYSFTMGNTKNSCHYATGKQFVNGAAIRKLFDWTNTSCLHIAFGHTTDREGWSYLYERPLLPILLDTFEFTRSMIKEAVLRPVLDVTTIKLAIYKADVDEDVRIARQEFERWVREREIGFESHEKPDHLTIRLTWEEDW
ncbi:hypothetical protein M3Y99_01612300 [Aphelenchoides fujianensis]|nr:hypothetical protein M3Y99_01612300 [Aphelenchoides fujianensis]